MWWKLLLLTFYLAVLFVLSRILEAVSYYDSGYLAARLLDPVALSVRKLKTLLDQRGVSYAGVVEKQELTDLVDASGEVNEGELDVATQTEEVTTSTNFTCGTHFYEEVEDTKDSVWVVQEFRYWIHGVFIENHMIDCNGFFDHMPDEYVVAWGCYKLRSNEWHPHAQHTILVVRDSAHPFMGLDDWRSLIKKLGRFSVRTGIFDCSLDYALCDRKNWYTSRLVLSLPLGNKPKDSVVLRSYTGSNRVQAAFDWVNFNLASRIRQIYDHMELQRDWLSWEERRHLTKVRVLLVSTMKIPPMFYSVMSVKFSGRVRFGTINVRSKEGKNILNRLRLSAVPTYMVLTPEGNATYGSRRGEYLNYDSMCVLLKTLHPEVNDMFLLSLIIVNVACWFDLFVARGVLIKRVGHLLWSIFKWNCFLILLWLPVLALFQLPYMGMVLDWMLKVLRLFSATPLAALVRADWLSYSSLHCCLLFTTFFMFAAATGLLRRLYKGPVGDDTSASAPLHNNNNPLEWWNFSWDGYMSYLFRPMATLTRPMTPQDLDLEVGMELLIERLAVPNFWLTPIISSDYIKDLPVWKYSGPSIDSDVCSDGESSRFDSDGEDLASSGTESPKLPYLFTCEKCRALQREQDFKSRPDGSDHGDEDEDDDELDSESACAKFLMDGDYKCLCKMSPKTPRSASTRGQPTPVKQRTRSPSPGSYGSDIDDPRQTLTKHPMLHDHDTAPAQTPPGILPSTECVICLEGYKFGVHLCGLPCSHAFHHTCILGWLSRDNHCCPVCRWPTYKAKLCSMHLHAE